ncbi:hypothetical protein AGMMS49992_33190 [Clostridia bacterium]|nr:hypothetical protein AGMMS49992_33190 [Clostridia bacterium]
MDYSHVYGKLTMNRMDINGVIACLDPSVGVVMKIATGLFGDVFGSDIGISGGTMQQAIDYMPDIMRVLIGTGYVDASQIPQVKITPLEYQEQYGVIRVKVLASFSSNGEYTEETDWFEIDDSGAQPYILVGLPDF